MKIVGLTGGIGSGKTTIANFFSELGVPIYTADKAAKNLMVENAQLVKEIKKLLGEEAYIKNELNRKWIANKVFNNKELLAALNNLVHPAVVVDFKNWLSAQDTPYVIKEAAILFENGGYKNCDYLILVKAPQSLRIDRVMKRDKSSKDEVLSRMNMQWSDNRKEALSDAAIENINLDLARQCVVRLHKHIVKRISSGW
ncbi:dephospho-CoA kinase [Dokdonia sp. Hel_I_53]|uniref:dephospho-CoA kinase n=1 Tax=Dokdonia sp. Hel_I_53 TaxID=1566287 RepID=UPI00119B4E21|nr:dephospho-CoA kinase [Dokdonia sp. Hel_I_53]TVZ53274.1 dephospho-CoA kinase [Dokdonia sp. Hel_I_53]